ncbi:phosphoribosyltransferase family protein [Nocardioides sp. 616]|uniref:ComF family protein n=1 Tax=Nocardioides sp. 616 TaxID=2268090 RepID=UPI00196292A1|nr:phosphoribosyltransferase family protein [Nocardioides sp. 616]
MVTPREPFEAAAGAQLTPGGVRDAVLDLVLGSSCLGCARPGRMVCPDCALTLPVGGRVSWPTPTPPGLATPWAAGEYAGLLRALVVGHKEDGRFSLGRPLGEALAGAVRTASRSWPAGEEVVLVPVPSRPGVARARGDDPTGRMVRIAARTLRAGGRRTRVAGLLRSHRGVRDQSMLDARERAANLALSMHCPSAGVRRLAAGPGPCRVVLCDDVLTTGATAREAQRALESVGLEVAAIAVVAAVRRRASVPMLPDGGFVNRRDPPRDSVGAWSPSGSVVASSGRESRPGGKPMPVAGETVHVRLSPALPES